MAAIAAGGFLAAVWALVSANALADGAGQAGGATPVDNIGRNLAATCAPCHGTNGVSRGGLPSLAGTDAAALRKAMQEFKAGKRPATIMHQLAKGYSEEDIARIAAFFAAQKRGGP